jgi:putative hemolysin
MSTSIFILLVVQIILIILNAIFASAEIAVLSMNETKLERMAEQGNNRAKRLHKSQHDFLRQFRLQSHCRDF